MTAAAVGLSHSPLIGKNDPAPDVHHHVGAGRQQRRRVGHGDHQVVALHRAVSVGEITARPVLADLAALLDERSTPRQPPVPCDGQQGPAGSSRTAC